MTTHSTQVLNYEFRSYCERSPYPFTSDSTYSDITGRRIPYSSFIDAIIYPPKYVSGVFISKICMLGNDADRLCLEVSHSGGILGYAYDIQDGTNFLFSNKGEAAFLLSDEHTDGVGNPAQDYNHGLIIGSIVLSHTEYIKGMAKIKPLEFSNNAFKFLPYRIKILPTDLLSLTVDGVNIPSDSHVVLRFDSTRFYITKDEKYDTSGNLYVNHFIGLDTTVIADPKEQLIESINNNVFYNHKCWIFSPRTDNNGKDVSDLRVVTSDTGIHILKIGDDVE